MELQTHPKYQHAQQLLYDITNPNKARLATTLTLDRFSSLQYSEEKGCEECLTLTYTDGKTGQSDEFTFYPESDSLSQPGAAAIQRSNSVTTASISSLSSSSSFIQERETDFESARNSIRLSIGAVSIIHQWHTELTAVIQSSKAQTPGPEDLQRLMRKKSLTTEETAMAQSLMRGERAFSSGTDSTRVMVPISGLATAPPPTTTPPAPVPISQIIAECSELEKSIATEIAKEVEQLPEPATATLGSKTITAADAAEMKRLMRSKSGGQQTIAQAEAEENQMFSRLSLVEAQNRAMESAENPDVLELQALEAALDQAVIGTNITLPANAIREKVESERRGSNVTRPPPPPRRRSSAEFPFHAGDSWQVSLDEGENVQVLTTHDDGWTKVRKSDDREGFVPTSFLKDCK
jgi:hypothetical protein